MKMMERLKMMTMMMMMMMMKSKTMMRFDFPIILCRFNF